MANLLFVAAASDNATAWRRDWMGVGHDVVTLESIDRAIHHLREGGIDLIILDTHDSLGSMSNLVASMNRLVDAPPLLLISDSPTAPEISARIGAAGFLPKPCDDNDDPCAMPSFNCCAVMFAQPRSLTGPVVL